MKTYTGSLQRRGKRYYLVVHRDGRQRWLALKTDKLPVARMRAVRIAPADPTEERAWLVQLVREGDRARAQLARLKASCEISWETLSERALAAVDATASDDSRACHEHWLSLIVNLLRNEHKVVRPGTLTSELARTAVSELCGRYRSARRIVAFVRRVWASIGLDPEIWPERCDVPGTACGGEYYRRMTVEEVRKVYAHLEVRGGAAPVDAASRRVREDRSRPYLTRRDAASTWEAAPVDAASRRVREDRSRPYMTRQDAASTWEAATVDAASRRVTEDRSRPYLTRQDAASTWGTRQDAASTWEAAPVDAASRRVREDRSRPYLTRQDAASTWGTRQDAASTWEAATVDAASRRVTEDRSRPYLTRQDAASTGTRRDAASTLADMVLIGYSTGLRLSDVAELELSEIALPFLRVVPNKTRRRKPNPLRIPLTDEALAVVTRLKTLAEQSGTKFLFDENFRHRPSRRIAAAFRRAGIVKVENGRASFHSLRATFISLMDEAGVPPHITDAITGHGGGGMHARYTQPSAEALRTAVLRAIPPLRAKF